MSEHVEPPRRDPLPSGRPSRAAPSDDGDGTSGAELVSVRSPASLIENADELLRVGTLIQTLVTELRNVPLDEPGRSRLAELHREAIDVVRRSVSQDLERELDALVPAVEGATPSEPELRVAQAQLAGWLEGLFRGIQVAALSRQMTGSTPGAAGPPAGPRPVYF